MPTETVPGLVGSERDVLLHHLNSMRNAVVRTTVRLEGAQLRAPEGAVGDEPAGPDPAPDVVEAHWFRLVILDEDPGVENAYVAPADVTYDEIVEAHREACRRSDEIVRAPTCPPCRPSPTPARTSRTRCG